MGRFRGNVYFEKKCEIKPLESGIHLIGEHKKYSIFQQCSLGLFWLCLDHTGRAYFTNRERGKKAGNRKRTFQMNSEHGNTALGNLNGLTLRSSGIDTEDMLRMCPSNHQKQEIALISRLKDHNFPRKQWLRTFRGPLNCIREASHGSDTNF